MKSFCMYDKPSMDENMIIDTVCSRVYYMRQENFDVRRIRIRSSEY